MYLCIQNPGVAPVEGFTLLGVSTTRDCGVAGAIGQFGSGNKHAINVLLRAGLKVVVYCGLTRLDFQTRDEEIDDGLVKKTVKRVVCKLGGTSTRTIDLGWVLDFGAIDWKDVGMALREFVSNAIDRTLREEGGEFIPAVENERLSVKTVDDMKKAKDGFTRIYVQANDDVLRYYGELSRRFLHFSDRPEQVKQSLLPKANRNLNGNATAMIYREGVLVREVEECKYPSVYDYNFRAFELNIDESRNSSEYEVKVAATRLLRRAKAEELVPVFRSLIGLETTFESQFDEYYLCASWETPNEEQQKNWQEAWRATAGDAVLCGPSETLANFVERKGYKPQRIAASSFTNAASRFGIKTDAKVLSNNEQNGRELLPATASAIKAVGQVWGWLEMVKMTNGKSQPGIACFRDMMNGETSVRGYAEGGTVYVREDIANDGVNKHLLQVAVEEVAHYVTGAGDASRDFQNFVIQLLIELAA